jgi:dephospho-CoA kinase
MKVFVIVGMPAAGKNIARTYAESKNLAYFATGDIVRAEVKKRGLVEDAANTSKVSDELRGADGMGVTKLVLEEVLRSGTSFGFLEGMRSWPEIELIRRKTDCVVVAFIATKSLRRSRMITRGRADDSLQAFDERDRREIAYGTSVPIALADEYILNTKTMEDTIRELDQIIKKNAAD